jgi:membrane protease YdiL (CAAX protease family)
MKSLKSHQRLLIFMLLILALTCVISPWLAMGAYWFATQGSPWPMEPYSFSRIFNRTFIISGIALFFACRRWLKIESFSQLGLVASFNESRDLLVGWALAIASMVALAAAMSFAGVFTPDFRLSLSESLSECASALLAGISVGFFEEIFFRGILFKGLLAEGNRVRAYILANLFYSALHFVKPGERYVLEQFDPLAGFPHLFSTFAPFLDPASILPGLFGLFLIGAVLSYALERTGFLYLSIGLHAGWVFSLKTIRVFGNYRRQDLGWIFGSTEPKIVSGIGTWLGILIVLIVVHRLTRERCGIFGGPPPIKAA